MAAIDRGKDVCENVYFFNGVLMMTVTFSKQASVMARCFAITALVNCVFGFASGTWGALLTPLATLFHISPTVMSRLSLGRTYRWV